MGHTNCDSEVALFIDFQLVHFHWVSVAIFSRLAGKSGLLGVVYFLTAKIYSI